VSVLFEVVETTVGFVYCLWFVFLGINIVIDAPDTLEKCEGVAMSSDFFENVGLFDLGLQRQGVLSLSPHERVKGL